jgi:hypothetical protein
MEIKSAVEEAGGDEAKAKQILKEKGFKKLKVRLREKLIKEEWLLIPIRLVKLVLWLSCNAKQILWPNMKILLVLLKTFVCK